MKTSAPEFWINEGDKIRCQLCPHNCLIQDGKTGICGVRMNMEGSLKLLNYGVISGRSLDPIEKKPLYHFYPGTNIVSIGSYGCNFHCDFCQNYNISQRVPISAESIVTPENTVEDAMHSVNNTGLAFTYNEPVIWYEYMRDCAKIAKEKGLHTVMVSNGFINSLPLGEVLTFIDAFNIDLKAFNDSFYKKLTGGNLESVKETIRKVKKSGKHIEITTLIIPELNDSAEEMKLEADWIAGETGPDTPLHISRYFPMYKRDVPPAMIESLTELAEIASQKLKHVYTGNVPYSEYSNTRCPQCGETVTVRKGYAVVHRNLDRKGRCRTCKTTVYKNFTYFSSSIKN
jgi:pyruvate formate lyase activating enzyme